MRNHLERDEQGKLRARATEEETILDAGLVLKAIGYRGTPFPGLPFDERRGVIANEDGRVAGPTGVLPGTYVTGWIKRGPRGIIGTNKQCSRDSIRHLLADWRAGKLSAATSTPEEILAIVKQRQPKLFTQKEWLALDRLEQQQGRKQNRPRVKRCSWDKLLAAC